MVYFQSFFMVLSVVYCQIVIVLLHSINAYVQNYMNISLPYRWICYCGFMVDSVFCCSCLCVSAKFLIWYIVMCFNPVAIFFGIHHWVTMYYFYMYLFRCWIYTETVCICLLFSIVAMYSTFLYFAYDISVLSNVHINHLVHMSWLWKYYLMVFM